MRRSTKGISRPFISTSTLTGNLISFWEFEDTSWTDAVVATGNDLTGNGTPLSLAVAPTKIGNYVQLVRATSQFLSHTDNASLSIGGSVFSFAAWVMADTFTDGQIIASKLGGFGDFEWRLTTNFIASGHQFKFQTFQNDGASSGGIVTASSFGNLSTATWYYIVAKASNGTLSICVNDGVVDTAAQTGSPGDKAGQFQIGAGASADFWNGRIDQAGFWKKVLSASEITQLYNSGAGLSFAAM